MTRGLVTLGCALLVVGACSGGGATTTDSGTGGGASGGAAGGGGGTGGGATEDAGSDDAGAGGDDGGLDAGQDQDAGTDGGADEDAGCGSPTRLVFASAPQSFSSTSCSTVVTVRLLDACGAPVAAPANVPLLFTASSGTMDFFTESLCIATRGQWDIAAGASEVSLYVRDSTPGTTTLTVSSTGLASATQAFTITCPTMQRACNGACIAADGCCTDNDCNDGGVAWVCNSSSTCVPPPCGGFPAGCTTSDYVDRTATAASRTVTLGTSGGWAPRCMRVTTSQDVTFSVPSNFALHPLVQFCGPSDRQMTTTFGTTKVVRFPQFGEYGYRCANHPVFEQGAIKVP